MKFGGSSAMREMDRYTIDVLGVPSEQLMLRAAHGLYERALSLLKASPAGKICTVFCGSGNNGGDGIAAAMYLLKSGIRVKCILVGSRDKQSKDSLSMEQLLEAAGGTLMEYNPDDFSSYIENCALIIDALFGTGLARPVAGKYEDLICRINNCTVPVLACDIASGINADNGAIMGIAVRATETVTFNLPKTGQLLPPGTEYTGKLTIHDIGIPQEAVEQVALDGDYITKDCIAKLFPPRRRETHKGSFGKILMLCGSTGYTGAAAMAAKAALRSGAGLVYLGVPETIYPIVAGKLDEAVVFPLPANASGQLAKAAIPDILKKLEGKDACLIGPGLGQSEDIKLIVKAIISHADCPLILDADALTAVSNHLSALNAARNKVILTPHEGEFRRLGGDLSKGRIAAARELSARTGAIVVLKGYRTITAAPDGRIFINSTGNPGMATGGSGDVLSGITACFAAQLKDPVIAASAAVWVHGAAGDLCADKIGEAGMLPGDMILALPEVMKDLTTLQ